MDQFLSGIGLEKFKILKESTWFDFSPLTILTGKNNAGKSSLLSALKILREIFKDINTSEENFNFDALQKIDTEALDENISNFENLININATKKEIIITLDLQADEIYFGKTLMHLTYSTLDDDKFKNGYLEKVKIVTLDEQHKEIIVFEIEIDTNKKHEFEEEDNKDYQNQMSWNLSKINIDFLNGLFSTHAHDFSKNLDFYINEWNTQEQSKAWNNDYYEIVNLLKYCKHNIQNLTYFSYDYILEAVSQKNDNIIESLMKFGFEKGSDINDFFINCESMIGEWYKTNRYNKGTTFSKALPFVPENDSENYKPILDNIETITEEDYTSICILNENLNGIIEIEQDLRRKRNPMKWFGTIEKSNHDSLLFNKDMSKTKMNHILKYFLHDVIRKGLDNIKTSFHNSEHIPAIRSFGKRNMNTRDGGYLALKTKEFIEFKADSSDFFTWAIKLFDIGEAVKVEYNPDSKTSSIFINKNANTINLVDSGFGYSQLLAIIMAICIAIEKGGGTFKIINDKYFYKNSRYPNLKYSKKLIIIEEPEANLHPALQSKLADLFIEASKIFKIQFIIETHSEYLIRKLQYHTAKQTIPNSFTNIYYFYPPDEVINNEPQVKNIKIENDGSLTNDFGGGFFDEADKIAMSIWNMHKPQNN